MKIAQSNIAMEGKTSKTISYEVTERLETWRGERPQQAAETAAGSVATEEAAGYVVQLQDQAEAARKQANAALAQMKKPYAPTAERNLAASASDTELQLLDMLMYLMTGRRIRLFDKMKGFSTDDQQQNLQQLANSLQAQGSQAQNYGLEYDYHEVKIEGEEVRFAANGSVQTEDGRSISFDIDMLMSRYTYEEKGFSLRLGQAAQQNICDPLVIAYGGGTPELSAERHAFDLTMDGEAEQIAFAVNGSGFLALDENNDGVINDGSELFGPQSGNGFMELAAYDLDANGWIDENDAVFSKLRVLTLNGQNEQVLFSLGELGVGAIYLNNVDTAYTMKAGEDTQGLMRSSSVFLKENGEAGSIHHIDLTI